MTTLDRLSKAAVALSAVLIIALQMALHPDMTWLLRALISFSLIFGWLSGRMAGQSSHRIWLVIAPLAPAFLLAFAHREGPVVEVVWMAGLTGALLRTLSWSKWSIPDGWKPLVGGWALTVCLAWPVIVAREAGYRLDGLFDEAAIVSAAPLSAPQSIGWALHVALTQLLGLLWLDLLCGLFRQEPERTPPVVHGLWIGATVASVVAIYQGAVDLSFLSTVKWVSERRATGTLLDANAFGMCAALAGPLAWVAIRAARFKNGIALATAVLIVNVIGMWMSGSRTALLAMIAGMAGVGIASRSTSAAFMRRILPITAAVLAIAISVMLVAGGAIGPLRRLLDTPAGAQSPWLELWNRGGYGTAALMMIRRYPLSGVGLSGFHVIVPDYRGVLDRLMPFDNAQNWWRHEAAELGLFGGAALISWSLVLAWHVITGRAAPNQRYTATGIRGLLVGIGLCSLLGVPTQSPLVLLWFMLLVAWLSVAIVNADVAPLRYSARTSIVAGLFAVAYALMHVGLGLGSLSPEARAVRAQRPYSSGAYPAELSSDGEFREFQWTRGDARFTWRVEEPYLLLKVAVQHPDVTTLPVQLTISTPCTTVLDVPVKSAAPLTLGLQLPPGETTVRARVQVSRTWRPSDVGIPDTRRLGAMISARFTPSEDRFRQQQQHVVLPANCKTS